MEFMFLNKYQKPTKTNVIDLSDLAKLLIAENLNLKIKQYETSKLVQLKTVLKSPTFSY